MSLRSITEVIADDEALAQMSVSDRLRLLAIITGAVEVSVHLQMFGTKCSWVSVKMKDGHTKQYPLGAEIEHATRLALQEVAKRQVKRSATR